MTEEFLITGIDENVKENQILSSLKQRAYIFIFRRKGTISSKLHVSSTVSSLLQKENFRPKYVNCKLWKSRNDIKNAIEQKTTANHRENYSNTCNSRRKITSPSIIPVILNQQSNRMKKHCLRRVTRSNLIHVKCVNRHNNPTEQKNRRICVIYNLCVAAVGGLGSTKHTFPSVNKC